MRRAQNYSRYPSEREVLDAVTNESTHEKKLEKFVLLVEYKKISNNLGIIKAKLIKNKDVMAKANMTCIPNQYEDFDWKKLNVGESLFRAYSLDAQKEGITSTIVNSVKNSLKEGRVPFLR